jgi:hypothetical protein
MLAPDAEADQARGYPAQERKPLEQSQRKRHLVEHRLADNQRRQHAVVHRTLRALDDLGRKHAPLLHFLQERIDILTPRERRRENVRGSDSVLDREIDADSSDRRHGVRRITDRKQAGTPPSLEPVERDG